MQAICFDEPITEHHFDSHEEWVQYNVERKKLAQLASLKEKWNKYRRIRQILILRYYQNKTLEEVGKVLGVTREYVRQLEAEGLRRLKALHTDKRSKISDLLAELNQAHKGAEYAD